MVLTFVVVDETLKCMTIQMKATEQYFPVVYHLYLRRHSQKTYKHLPKDVFDAASLPEEGINNWSPFRDHWSLKKVAENRQNWVERLELAITSYFKPDSLTDLTQDDQVQNDWCS